MDATPNMPYDPNTDPNCSWWWDNDGSIACKNMPGEWGITLADFLRWNPSITSDCGNYITGKSYCVEGSAPDTSTPTSTGNGIETPEPTQPDMVGNCNKFYFVKTGDSCDSIASKNGITSGDLLKWNPSVGSTCTGLWANAYVCVGIIGGSPTTTTKPPATTTGNGISTPTPTQPDMVANCNKFYFVKSGDSCASISSKNSITEAQFLKWNPSVGSTCNGLWANAYVCIGIIGGSPTTTTKPPATTTGNGITTPTPTQPNMVSNCNKFYLVKSGDICDTIASKNGITPAQFRAWNPSVGTDCSGLWANAYACVGRIGTPTTTSKPTTTTKGNGVTTPTPTQDGMVSNCKKFHLVAAGDSCASIAKKYSITTANFIKWNPAAKSDCTGLWAKTYACVGLI
ncbi:LysM domain-containing protein [Thelonectria olida]|uniref:LysM domain-containing protein n=1 Tax=Thelonectria olida TaxID=1576542 RepID=A0A9P8VRH7_9HYPO|nr:LysM domain-containing protein [Thelonectria olida]